MTTAAPPQRLLAAWALPAAFVIASVELQRSWATPLQWPYALVVGVYGLTWIAAVLDKRWAWAQAQHVIDAGIALMAAAGLTLLGTGQASPGQRGLLDLLLWSPLICAWWAASRQGQPGRTATLVIALYLATLPGCWPNQLADYWQHAFQGILMVFVLNAFFEALTATTPTHSPLNGDAWMRDPTTGVANRTYIEAELAHLAALANRYPFPFSVIVVQISAGENLALLRDCAWRIVERVRRPDTVCRWDDTRFLVLLPNTALPDASRVAADLHAELGPLTPVRTGVAEHPAGGDTLAAVQLAELSIHGPAGDPAARHPEARLPF